MQEFRTTLVHRVPQPDGTMVEAVFLAAQDPDDCEKDVEPLPVRVELVNGKGDVIATLSDVAVRTINNAL